MKEMHEIAAIVDDDIRMNVQCLINIGTIFLIRAGMCCKDMQAIFDESRRNIILR